MSWNKEMKLDMYNELQFFNLLDLQKNEQNNEHKNMTEQAYIKTREQAYIKTREQAHLY